jgi:glyoxylase-like metal-dependent hydrolase (beta-lactamase superfamily II)
MATPSYKVTKWVADGEQLTHNGAGLGLQAFHGPDHTPDSIAVWDPAERVLFVGDTMYEWAGICFPSEGSLVAYSETLGRLKSMILEWNKSGALDGLANVQIACGHVTHSIDGALFVEEVDVILFRVLHDMVKATPVELFRDDMLGYVREDGRIAFVAPQRLWDAFRADLGAMERIALRQPASDQR